MISKILNVGEDDQSRQRITSILRRMGCSVVEASSETDAVEQLSVEPHLIIVDRSTAGATREILNQQVRSHSAGRWVPILELCPSTAEIRGPLLRNERIADATLCHPVDEISLINTVNTLNRSLSEVERRVTVERELARGSQEIRSLKISNDRMTSLLESITDGFYSLDREWRFTYLNRAAERISRRSREELLGKCVWEVFPEAVETPAYVHYHRAVRENTPVTFELNYAPLDVWLEINVYPTPEGVLAYYREISERKRAEAELSEYAALQAAITSIGERALSGADLEDLLFEASLYVGSALGVECTSIFELDPSVRRLLLRTGSGWSDELLGSTWVEAGAGTQAGHALSAIGPVAIESLPEEDRFSVTPLLREAGIISDLSVIIYGQSEPFGILSAHSRQRRHFSEQEQTFVQSVANTLAAAIRQRKLQEDLRRSQTSLARAQQIGRVGSWIAAAGSETVIWSEELFRIFGEEPGRFEPRMESIQARVHPEDRQVATERANLALEQGGCYQLDHRIVLPDGSVRWIQVRAEREVDGDGHSRLVGTVLDVTEQKQAEQALRESEERYRVLFDRSPFPRMLYDEQTLRFLAVNEAATEHYGFSDQELLQKTLRDLWVIQSDAEAASIQDLPVRQAIRALHRRKDGTRIEVEVHIQKALLRGQSVRIAVIQDLSERARLEGQLRQAQKMEAVGRLAGGVAHDFNNMLAVINGYSELLLHLTDADTRPDLHRPLLEIQKAGERAARLTRQLLAFSRKQVLSPKVLDLGELVRDIDRMLARLIGEDIEVHVSVAPRLRLVKADPGQLEQVLLNLVVNSRDAMPTGGKLTIEVRNSELDEEYTRRHRGISPGEFVLLAVTDTGCGMSTETLERAFEPFFTTKGPEHGTGLGLATVFGIVQQSGGHIDAYSEVGIGTTIKIYLPSARTEAEAAPAARTLPASGSGTVLLVEDEPMVRALVHDVLTMFGYQVLAASNGVEALEVVSRLEPKIDLLLTDVVMPGGIGGRQLAERLRAERPGLKVLYMSGYTDDAVVRHGIVEADTAFIHKPFTAVALARKVKEVLG